MAGSLMAMRMLFEFIKLCAGHCIALRAHKVAGRIRQMNRSARGRLRIAPGPVVPTA